MDRGTRIYAYILSALVTVVLVTVMYQPAKVRELNDMLADDGQLAAYPYPFRVVSIKGGTAEMRSPRSASMPVQRMIGAIHPELKDRSVDDPAYLRAQLALAEHQALAKRLVLADPDIDSVHWTLDEAWLDQRGIQALR